MKWTTFPADVLPLWVAEMDVPLAEPVAARLHEAIDAGDTGYPSGRAYARALQSFAADRWGWGLRGRADRDRPRRDDGHRRGAAADHVFGRCRRGVPARLPAVLRLRHPRRQEGDRSTARTRRPTRHGDAQGGVRLGPTRRGTNRPAAGQSPQPHRNGAHQGRARRGRLSGQVFRSASRLGRDPRTLGPARCGVRPLPDHPRRRGRVRPALRVEGLEPRRSEGGPAGSRTERRRRPEPTSGGGQPRTQPRRHPRPHRRLRGRTALAGRAAAWPRHQPVAPRRPRGRATSRVRADVAGGDVSRLARLPHPPPPYDVPDGCRSGRQRHRRPRPAVPRPGAGRVELGARVRQRRRRVRTDQLRHLIGDPPRGGGPHGRSGVRPRNP